MTHSRMSEGLVQRGKTWSYVVRELDSRTGKTKPRWVGGFATRAAARKARDQARHAINRGTYVAPQSLTVGEFLDRWIDAHSVSLKPSTAQSYRANIDRYLKPANFSHQRGCPLSSRSCMRAVGPMATRCPPGRSSSRGQCCAERCRMPSWTASSTRTPSSAPRGHG